MKTLHANKYRYSGIDSNLKHVFENIIQTDDGEEVHVRRARFVLEDETSIYFDPVSDDRSAKIDQYKRMAAYHSKINTLRA